MGNPSARRACQTFGSSLACRRRARWRRLATGCVVSLERRNFMILQISGAIAVPIKADLMALPVSGEDSRIPDYHCLGGMRV